MIYLLCCIFVLFCTIALLRGGKMKYKKKKEPKKQPPITIIGDCVTREIMKIKAIKG